MEEHSKSLALQYDLFFNGTLKFLDTSIERDYMLKLKIIDELMYKINEGEIDRENMKKKLEAVQDECSKLSYKLKTSARLLDEVQIEKEKVEYEKETIKLQLEELGNIFKKPNTTGSSQTHHSQTRKKILNNTDDLLSDLSYSHSEDSSDEIIIKKSKNSIRPLKDCSTNNVFHELDTKTCELRNINITNGHVIATTTLTMEKGTINAKSIIKTHSPPTLTCSSLSNSVESLFSSDSEKELKLKNNNDIDTKTEKDHNFVLKIVVIPEVCGQCFKKIKFNNRMIKCLDCKTVAHLECKDFIPTSCSFDQHTINALNCGVPPLIVHCINEIEKRGLNTMGLYRIPGSDKEVKILRDQFRKGIPNLIDVDIHVLCSCLKDYIRMQKTHLISQNKLSKLAEILKEEEDEIYKLLSQAVSELPSTNRNTLAFLILHLQKVANSPVCNMDYSNLAIVFGPTIIGLSSTCLDDLHIKSEVMFQVVTELLKLTESFWLSFLKTDSTSVDEMLYSTPVRSKFQTPGSSKGFFSSGLKRRILDSPKANRAAKQIKTKTVEFID